jgi:hypothetical protein
MLEALSSSLSSVNITPPRRTNLAETNCPTDVFDSSGFSLNSGKRTARPNSLVPQGIILKILKPFIRFDEPSMIGRLRSAKAETNWYADLSDPEGLNRDLGKRTGTPKFMKIIGIILKTPKIFIRCHQQIRNGFGAGIGISCNIFRPKLECALKSGDRWPRALLYAPINELEPARDSGSVHAGAYHAA